MSSVLPQFVGAIRTRELVGRKSEQEVIARAISPKAGTKFQLVVLVAPGGIGKTRLLQQTCHQLGLKAEEDDEYAAALARDTRPEAAHIIGLPLIDVSDPDLHGVVPFLRRIRNGFTATPKLDSTAFFAAFDQALAKYDNAREGQASYTEVLKLADIVRTTFEENYAVLTNQYRVVWVLDTLEQLYTVQPEIQLLLNSVEITEDDIGQSSYSWLISFIKSRPRNTTIVLAGRPFPGRWLDDIASIREKNGRRSFVRFELQPFSPTETAEYLVKLHNQLATTGERVVSAYLADMREDPERSQILYELTEGNPIRLALYIDMIVNIKEEPDAFHMRLKELRALDRQTLEAMRHKLDGDLLAYIQSGIDQPEKAILGYLLVTRRSLNARRLQQLYSATEQECATFLQRMRKFSFVKYQGNGRYALHDELYVMYQRWLVAQSQHEQAVVMQGIHDTHEKIIAYCDMRIKEITQQIADFQGRYRDRKTLSEQEREALRRLRLTRRRRQVEKLHYQLYLDPETGFYDQYYLLAEQAFGARDSDLDTYLQAEVEQFFFGTAANLNRQQTGITEERWATLLLDVVDERLARWIKRLTQYNKYRRAQLFAEEVRQRYDELFASKHPQAVALRRRTAPTGQSIHFLSEKEWGACRYFAAIFLGESVRFAIDSLQPLVQELETYLKAGLRPGQSRNRVLNTIAQCYLYIGYGYALLGSFEQARRAYNRGDVITQRTENDVLFAELMNNHSRVKGELGDLHDAVRLCETGIAIRTRLGFDGLLALSYSTMALIYARNNRPNSAMPYAEEALLLGRQLNQPRTIGLALTRVAEIKRRSWLLDKRAVRVVLLEEAEAYLQEAIAIFKDTAVERVRLIEAELELGCLYRDWAAFHGDKEHDTKYDQSLRWLKQAAQLAEGDSIRYHLAALSNQGWLYAFCGQNSLATQVADQVWAQTPDEYKLTTDRPLQVGDTANVGIFAELSKLFALRAKLLPPTPENYRELVHHHLMAITYMQLFSRSDAWYLGVNKSELYSLLIKADPKHLPLIRDRVREVIEEYHLRATFPPPMVLQAEHVVEEYIASEPIPDYLD